MRLSVSFCTLETRLVRACFVALGSTFRLCTVCKPCNRKGGVLAKTTTLIVHHGLSRTCAISNRTHTTQCRLKTRRTARSRVVRPEYCFNDWRKQMSTTNETAEALGDRIAALYREMSYPGAAKFQSALRKRN